MAIVADNIARVRERMARAASRCGRDASAITLVVVTKGVEPARVDEALAAGVREIGESRVQEAQRLAYLAGKVTMHLVGHLQTNKAGAAVELFDVVQSLDSARLAQALQRRAEAVGKRLPVLIEVNTTGEPTKYGAASEELGAVLDALRECPNLLLRGLMTIGPLGGGEAGARSSFRRLRDLRGVVASAGVPGSDPTELSMGMTDDFEVAIEEGATIVRIGSAIFGARHV